MRWGCSARRLRLAVLLAVAAVAHLAEAREVVLWHSYRAAEAEALAEVVEAFEARYPTIRVRTLAVPYDAFASKLSTAIPRGNGPDVFIFAHERIGAWAESGVVEPLDEATLPLDLGEFLPPTVEALRYEGRLYGLPLSFKSVTLFYNKAIVPAPPKDTQELIRLGRALSDPERGEYGLAYEASNFYFHAPWLFGFGGQLFDAEGHPQLDTPEIRRSFEFVRRLVLEERIVPQEVTGALVTRLFNEGRAAMVVSGPWLVGEIDPKVDYGLALLPVVSETGRRAAPFLTVEAALLARGARDPEAARLLMAHLATDGAVTRGVVGRQTVAYAPAYEDPRLSSDPVLTGFRRQLAYSVPMDNRPAMQALWEPGKGALAAVMRGVPVADALRRAQSRIEALVRPPARPVPVLPYVLVIGALLLAVTALWVRRVLRESQAEGGLWRRMRRAGPAYAYVAPALLGLLFLVVVPFTVGLAISLTRHENGTFVFVGFANFADILFGQRYGITDPLNFYFTLGVTALWTAANVTLHVSLGLALALLLRAPWLKLKGVYRALLIVPWAVPNYITALIWKGMFHKQFGAINEVLGLFGIEPVGWFSHFWTALTANVVTNTWLGFPFMMVVALGALQSIPKELYEAAEVDGASAWQRFRHVTLPLLGPAMLPAVLLGTIWTFNMFNVVYLVSGGEPDGSTDILISEAYRWAFQRQEQYGYAAAYATLIFFILLGYTLLTRRFGGQGQIE